MLSFILPLHLLKISFMKTSFARRSSRRSKAFHQDRSLFSKEGDMPFFSVAPPAPFFSSTSAQPVVQRKCDKCKEEEKKESGQNKAPQPKPSELPKALEEKKKEDKKLMRKEAVPAAVNASGSLASPGAATSLPAESQSFFGRRIGYDFSHVIIHTDAEADRAAKALHAKAYTLGNHIVFAEGQYNPGSNEGRHLLAHELTHVMQQDGQRLQRKAEPAIAEGQEQEEFLGNASTAGVGTKGTTKRSFANCAGAHVQGATDANYDHGTYSVSGAAVTRATGCEGCAANQCVTVQGTIVSVFQANPQVTLPSVPAGNWNACERQAIQNFIDTTLSQHEQQHVAAFNTYNGTVRTPFTYRGCQAGWEAYVRGIHEGVNLPREQQATRLSDALDANGANNFTINCECPDPEPPAAAPGS